MKPYKIGIQGSSAGGHLAALTRVASIDASAIGDSLESISPFPNLSILVSPVIDLGTYTHKDRSEFAGRKSERRCGHKIFTTPSSYGNNHFLNYNVVKSSFAES